MRNPTAFGPGHSTLSIMRKTRSFQPPTGAPCAITSSASLALCAWMPAIPQRANKAALQIFMCEIPRLLAFIHLLGQVPLVADLADLMELRFQPVDVLF